jgi:hypothetical protein
MIEDKLSQEQRLRLECLAQANITHAARPAGPSVVVETARKFEDFVKDGVTQ